MLEIELETKVLVLELCKVDDTDEVERIDEVEVNELKVELDCVVVTSEYPGETVEDEDSELRGSTVETEDDDTVEGAELELDVGETDGNDEVVLARVAEDEGEERKLELELDSVDVNIIEEAIEELEV